MSLVSSAVAFGLGCSVSALARAQGCAPGDWFCDPASEPVPPPAEPPPAEPPDGAEDEQGGPPDDFSEGPAEFDEPGPPQLHSNDERFARWGAGIHVFGALLGHKANLGGVGLGVRHFFVPEFALEGNFELGFGTDYNGFQRQEGSFLLHGVGVLNPRSAVRAYGFGGLGFSLASVSGVHAAGGVEHDEHYTYFGGDLGAGVEARVTKNAAIHLDLLGFIRGRTDDDRDSHPEFVDAQTGRTTNTSGGVLLRVGSQFFW